MPEDKRYCDAQAQKGRDESLRLERALGRADCLPERQSERLARAVAEQQRVLIDGTERPVGRSIDDATQKEHYSGKKNAIRS